MKYIIIMALVLQSQTLMAMKALTKKQLDIAAQQLNKAVEAAAKEKERKKREQEEREKREQEEANLNPYVRHEKIKDRFIELQKEVGIATKDANKKPIYVRNQRADQAGFNTARVKINNLLSQLPLDEAAIRTAIQDLENLKPARWPRAADYRELLEAKLKAAGKK